MVLELVTTNQKDAVKDGPYSMNQSQLNTFYLVVAFYGRCSFRQPADDHDDENQQIGSSLDSHSVSLDNVFIASLPINTYNNHIHSPLGLSASWVYPRRR